MTPYHPLTATAAPPEGASVIWPWPNNWSDPFTQRIAYKTAVMPTAAGKEQRQALREIPREVFVVNNLLEHPDSATALSLLRARKGKKWLVPGWHEMAHTTAPAGQILSLDRYSCRPGLALLGTEVVTIASTSGALDAPPVGTWPEGTTLVPLYEATLDEDQSTEFITRGVARLSLAFEVTRATAPWIDARVGAQIVAPQVTGAVASDGSPAYANALMAYPSVTTSGVSAYRVNDGSAIGTVEMDLLVPSGITAPIQAIARAGSGESGNYITLHNGTSISMLAWLGDVGLAVPVFDQQFRLRITRSTDNLTRAYVNGVLAAVGSGTGSVFNPPGFSGYHLFPSGFIYPNVRFTGQIDNFRATAADKGTAPVTTSAVVGYANPFWDREEVLLSGSPYPWGRYLGGITPRHHLLPDAHNWGGSTGVSVSRPVEALDVPEGSRHTRPIEAHSVTRWSMSVVSSEADEILAVKSWLHLHRGSAISFFAAVPGADVTIAAQAGTSLTVPELRFYADPSPFVGISLLVAGEWEPHLFAETAVGSSVTLATAPSGPATVGRLITRARLMGDEVEIRYHHLGLAEVVLPITTVIE